MKHILNNYFENIHVIAHPDSLRYKLFNERWNGLQYSLEKFVMQESECKNNNGYAWHIFECFPNNIPLQDPLCSGQIACAIAHMLIYKKIIDQKLDNCLILEDDSVFNNISNLEIGLKSDYDILALFTADCDLYVDASEAAPIVSNYTRAGTSAYIIRTPEIARSLLDSQVASMNTADGVIMRSDKKVYAVYPPTCSCDNSPSVIVNGFY